MTESDINGWTPLHYAAQQNRKDICRYLIHKGACVDHMSHNGTPLHLAASLGHRDICEILIEAKADTEKRNCNGLKPIDLAYKGHHHDASAFLMQCGSKLTEL